MAQKNRPQNNQGKQDSTPPSPPTTSNRDKIVGALLALLAERSWRDIGLADIATRAGVSLSDLRGEFGSPLAVLAAHFKDTDRAVLAGGDNDMSEETPRERLFDVLMRRLEVLAPHKAAIRSLMKSARRNPGLALALNSLSVRSQQWMLTAANIGASGPKGAMRAQGTALVFSQALAEWLDDDDPGLAKTMSTLDRGLSRGARLSSVLDDLCAIPERCCRPRSNRKRAPEGAAEAEAA